MTISAEDRDKDDAFTRAVAVARSCRTREQLNAARQYARQFKAAYKDIEKGQLLDDIISEVDRKLFALE